MRTVIYIVILALLFLAPIERVDVADLLPIEAVAIYMEEGNVVLETDTENIGRGADVTKALDNMKESAPAVVYLDTAEFLIVSQEAEIWVDELRQYLKPSVGVCIGDARGQVRETAKYLDVHENLVELKHWKSD